MMIKCDRCKVYCVFLRKKIAFLKNKEKICNRRYCDKKIAERRERFKHEYIFLKFNIKNVLDILQLIINKKN